MKRLLTEATGSTTESRLENTRDIDYYHGDQRSSAERAALAKRKQPDSVWNHVKFGVNGMLGVVERGKSEPRCYPRTPQDDDSADVATDVLRYLTEESRFTYVKSDVFLDMLTAGTGAVLVGIDADRQVTAEQIRWEEFFFDPRSRKQDFRDARYMGVAKWMFADDVIGMYPDHKDDVENAISSSPSLVPDLTYEDRPDQGVQMWVDPRQRRILVVDLYFRHVSGWCKYTFHASGVLEEGASPYQDQRGKPCCPIEAQSIYVDRQNWRYGVVRDWRGPQDEINRRHSKALHLMSVSQIEPVDAMSVAVDVETARLEAARPDGVIPMGYRRVPNADLVSGQMAMLAEAKGHIERAMPNPAVLGRDGTDSSGRALLARQQAGLVELSPVFSGLEDWELRVLKQMWARVRQFWDAPKWIRVTDEEGAARFVGLNQPVGPPVVDPQTGQQAQHPQTGEPMHGQPMFHPAADPATGQPHPQAGQSVFGYKNAVAEMDIDIILDTTPDSANIQAEQFAQLMQLVQSNPAYQQQVPFNVFLQLSALPHKRQIIDQIKDFQAQQAPQQQVQQQMALAAGKAKIDETNSRAHLNEAKAGEATVKTITGAHKAGHDIIAAPGPAPAPAPMQPALPGQQPQQPSAPPVAA